MSCFGSGSPFELPNVDLVSPSSRARFVINSAKDRLVSGNPLCQHDACVVRGLNDDAMQQVVHRYLVVDRDEHARRVRRRSAPAPGIDADDEFLFRLEPPLRNQIEHHLGRHQLGKAGGRNEIVSRLFEQYAAAVGVDQNGVRGRGLIAVGRLRSGNRIGGSPGCCDAAREDCRGAEFAPPQAEQAGKTLHANTCKSLERECCAGT